MKKFNIYNNLPDNLGNFKDDRGTITDIFYNMNLNHVAIIDSVPLAERGNHYHAKSVQHMFIISGSLQYWYKNESITLISIVSDVLLISSTDSSNFGFVVFSLP